VGSNPSRRFTRPAAGAEIDELDTFLALLERGDEQQAEAAMNALVAQAERVIPVMKTWLISPNADRRWWAVSILAQIDTADTELILPALQDESIEVRQAAALGVAYRPDPKAVPALIDTLQAPDRILSSIAVNALIEIGADAVSALLDLLKEPQTGQSARIGAMRALAKIADTRAIPAMMTALEEDSALMRHWAEIGLEELGLDMVYLKLE
jgi:HEAT repeat protein